MAAISAPLRLATPARPIRPQEQRRPAQPQRERASWLDRWLGRRRPTTYLRCLAIHMYFAAPRSALF